jgi:hypothetical protein
MIMDNLLQSNLTEKFYSVVIAITMAIAARISASLVLIPMALSILLLEIAVK